MSKKFFAALAGLTLFCVAGINLHAQPNVLTWHNDNDRTGLNGQETILTPSNVNAGSFGKVGFFGTDGAVDAEPLYVAGVKIAGATRNVLFIATEHDSVYAKQADNGAWLWKTSLLKSGETPSDDQNCTQISPEIGVTSTPVIDLSKGPNGAIYVVSMTKDGSGKYHQRISALDLTTGAQLFGGPKEITASYPGTAAPNSNGYVTFDPGQYAERAGLLEWRGQIYTSWTSHCDRPPYTGWIIRYDPGTLKQTGVFNLTPNGSHGAIWMGGSGLAASQSRIFALDGNGSFGTTLDAKGFPANRNYGNAAVALGLAADGVDGVYVADYYATDTTVQQSNADTDLGSGGVMVLPTYTDSNGNIRALAVGAGKDNNIYVFDRNDMGRYHPNGGSIYQVLSRALPHGAFSAPAFLNDKVYYGGVGDTLKEFSIVNARLVTTPETRSAHTFGYPGTMPSISANGTSNGIVWAVSHSDPATLYAYHASDLSEELYNSDQSGSRDQFGAVDHFITNTIANGRVYVPTTKGVAVFGLLGK